MRDRTDVGGLSNIVKDPVFALNSAEGTEIVYGFMENKGEASTEKSDDQPQGNAVKVHFLRVIELCEFEFLHHLWPYIC